MVADFSSRFIVSPAPGLRAIAAPVVLGGRRAI
jgi:hypothetical protein